MDAEEFILEAKQLRAAADEAEQKFMEFLFEGEKNESIWQGFGMTYLEFLERNGVCRASRYARWKKGRVKAEKALGEAQAKSFDFEGIMAFGGRIKVEEVPEAATRMLKWKESNQASLTQFAASKITKDTRNSFAVHRAGTPSMATLEEKVSRLSEEVDTLKTRIEALKDTNRTLRAENKKLKSEKRARKQPRVEA